MSTATRIAERRGLRACLSPLALVIVTMATNAAAQQGPDCELRADDWTDEGSRRVLLDVDATCGHIRLTGDRAWIDGDRLVVEGEPAEARVGAGLIRAERLDVGPAGALTATDACVSRASGGGPSCCGSELRSAAGSAWRLDQAVCQTPDGVELRATAAVWSPGGVSLESTRSGDPVGLPYPGGRLDAEGRRPGLSAPVLGYRSDRGAGGRANVWLPLGRPARLALGLFGESDGGVGLDLEVGWAGERPEPHTLGGFVAWDGTTDRAFRGELRADASLEGRAGIGLAAVGTLWSDGAIGRDYGRTTAERRRRDHHLALAGWAGGGGDRLWLGVYEQQITALPTGRRDTPAPAYFGRQPAAGWLAALNVERVASLGTALRFDRAADTSTGEKLNALRLVAGGELRAIAWPALTVLPGFWLELGADFSEPDLSTPYRRYTGRLLASLSVSSPWVGGRPGLRHLIEPRFRLLWRIVEAIEQEGSAPSLAQAGGSGPPLWMEAGIGQSLSMADWRLTLPIDWVARLDSGLVLSRLVVGTSLERTGPVRWQLDQRLEIDLDAGSLSSWTGATSLFVGGAPQPTEAGTPALGRGEVSLGVAVTLVEAGQRALAGLTVPTSPLLSIRPGPEAAVAYRGGRAWVNTDLGPLGLGVAALWPLSLDQRPDLLGALWLGRANQLRWMLTGSYLGDDTAIVHLSLMLGDQRATGPWSP